MTLPSLQECAAAFERLSPEMAIAASGSVLVLGLAALIVLAMRRASGSARHEVWMLGFTGVLLLPILSAMLPGWHVLPRLGASVHAPPPINVIEEFAVVPISAPPSAPSHSTPNQDTTMNTTNESPGAASPQSAPTPPASLSQATPPILTPSSTTPARAATPLPWSLWAIMTWAIGSLLVLCRVLLGHLSIWSLQRRCSKVTRGELFDLLERLRNELGLRRRVHLLTSPARTMPMTWGLWRTRLLVPEQATSWPAGQRRDVLLHELGHVQRRDCLTQFLSQVTCALYWFNPLAWVAIRRMQVERERACDDLVLRGGAEAPAYARHLLQSVCSDPALRLAGAAVAMARPSTLEERMRAILDPRMSRRGLTARGSLAAILLLLSALVPVAALKAQQLPPDAPPVNRGSAQPARDGAPPAMPTSRPGGGRFGARGFGGAGGPPPVMGEGPTCTFDATIYDVRLPVDQIGKLDVDALAKASETPDAFEKALAQLGTTKPMYRANQSVRLAGDSINISTQVPIITSNNRTALGQTVSNYAYQSVGAIFTVAGKATSPANSELDLSIRLATTSDTGVAVGADVTVPVIRAATLSRKGPFEPRKPFVVVSVDATSVDKEGKAVAYIARITLGDPQQSAPK